MARVEISATEFPHFARLVDFLTDCEAHAEATGDEALARSALACRDDLTEMTRTLRGAPQDL